ncbi:kinase-like domain-containing protein [Gautieria morchelliformis]|nr:kinase-like domain-containing protein [Gautieria morchelliformis]
MTDTPVPAFTRDTLPKTLRDWRASGWEPEGTTPRDVWTPLEPFFLEQGLTLWKSADIPTIPFFMIPGKGFPRSPDGFVYSAAVSDANPRSGFDVVKAIHCPARTIDNRYVLIRLVAKGDDGLNHLAALRRLGTGAVAFRGDNHIVPMLREIVLDDMTFVVFPLLHDGFDSPWYYNYGEVLDAVYQVTEGLAFCHERLVAHLDIDVDNILVNFKGGARQHGVTQPGGVLGPPTPFRADFPVRYYLNDFELAVCYEHDSDPSTRVVSGLPTKDLHGKYGRAVVPEMLSELPYCPFRADVWQLGRMFLRCFQHLDEPWTLLTQLFIEMTSEEPLSRPTMAQALKCIRQFRSTLSWDSLASRVPRPPPGTPPKSITLEPLPEPATDALGTDPGNASETDRESPIV